MTDKKALIVIDLQNDITKNYRDIIGNVNAAIDWAAGNGIHIVYIRHENTSPASRTFKPGMKGFEFVPELKLVSDNRFTKSKSSVLTCPEFASFLEEKQIEELYIVGADATGCVKSACFNLCKAGYKVNIFSDCVTSYDKSKIPEMLSYYESKGCIVDSFVKQD